MSTNAALRKVTPIALSKNVEQLLSPDECQAIAALYSKDDRCLHDAQ